MALLTAAGTWAVSALLKQPSPTLALAGGGIGLGFRAIALACGLFDLDPAAEIVEREVPEVLRSALEQMPRRLGGILGYFGGVLFAVAAVWLCQRWPGAALPVALACAAAGHLPLLAGYRRLRQLGL